MYVYAGIDEAGYGPMFGPLLVGRMVLGIPHLSAGAPDEEVREYSGRQLWRRLSKAVCRDLTKRNGRIAVNDSKKLRAAKTPAAARSLAAIRGDSDDAGLEEETSTDDAEPSADGSSHRWLSDAHLKSIEHLERGVLAFAALAGHQSKSVCEWLDCLGETCHHDLGHLPWYAASEARPWDALPRACTEGEIAVARSLLASTAAKAGVQVLDLGAAVVFEDRFNKMVSATRSKAATSFTFVANHLRAIWDRFGEHHPRVVVDRQSGRMHYRELLSLTFPEADLSILEESPEISGYRVEVKASHKARPDGLTKDDARAARPVLRAMTITFEVDSEQQHMPVALASMVSKYTRELLMSRFGAWFLTHAPHVRPTAGYASDAKRFWEEIQPELIRLSIDPGRLARIA